MGDIIYHDFRKVIHADFTKAAHDNEPISEAEAFVLQLAAELDEQDFWDFVEAVNDPGLYDQLDEDLKDLVDRFYACNIA